MGEGVRARNIWRGIYKEGRGSETERYGEGER